MKEYRQRPYVKAKMKEYRQKPEVKAKKKEYRQRPYVKARIKEYLQRPEVKAKMKEYLQRPEVKAKYKKYRQKFIYLPTFGGKGEKQMYTNGITKEAKILLPKIIDKVLNDCIKNPGRYLEANKMDKNFYQDGRLIERIDWEKIMPMPRCAGGHDAQMQGLLKDITILAHWNIGEYWGTVATCVMLNDTQEIVIYNDYYGTCPGCDAWEDASDKTVMTICKQLAGGALIFKNLEECKKFLSSKKDATQYAWGSDACNGLLKEMNADKNTQEDQE